MSVHVPFVCDLMINSGRYALQLVSATGHPVGSARDEQLNEGHGHSQVVGCATAARKKTSMTIFCHSCNEMQGNTACNLIQTRSKGGVRQGLSGADAILLGGG